MVSKFARRSGRQGFTLVEVTVALGIGSMLMLSLISLTVMVGRIAKATTSQQIALKEAKKTMETINRQIRPAMSPLSLMKQNEDDESWGNAIDFTHWGETVARRIELSPGADGDFDTPWDNALLYFPDAATGANKRIITRQIAPIDPRGAFRYNGVVGALDVGMRIGDPIGEPATYRTGVGVQGAEVHLSISPRN